ncbi:MAG: hypothetical protein DWH78_14615 [Planctomycetota bacterium]|nr:MAG: hypothetical protein DWH78_14615 [Planctomycetota bacterium]
MSTFGRFQANCGNVACFQAACKHILKRRIPLSLVCNPASCRNEAAGESRKMTSGPGEVQSLFCSYRAAGRAARISAEITTMHPSEQLHKFLVRT